MAGEEVRPPGEEIPASAADTVGGRSSPESSTSRRPAGKPEGREGGKPFGRLWVTPVSEIHPREVEWIWRPFIPKGELTLVEGLPKTGKSYFVLATLARLSSGAPLPGDNVAYPPMKAAILDFENHPEVWTRPILEAHDADLARIALVERPEGMLSLEGDLPELRRLVEKSKIDTVFIDGLMTWFGATANAYSDTEVRALLTPLARMAQDLGVAVIAIRHLRKSGGTATTAGVGSIAFTAIARSIITVGLDDEGRNCAAASGQFVTDRGSRVFRIEGLEGRGIGRVVFEGRSDATADDLAMPRMRFEDDEGRSELDEACRFLKQFLADGPKPTKDVESEAKDAGVSKATLRRARARLRIVAEKAFAGGWSIRLPSEPTPPPRESGGLGSLGENEPETPVSSKATKTANGDTRRSSRRSSTEDERLEPLGENEPETAVSSKASKALIEDACAPSRGPSPELGTLGTLGENEPETPVSSKGAKGANGDAWPPCSEGKPEGWDDERFGEWVPPFESDGVAS